MTMTAADDRTTEDGDEREKDRKETSPPRKKHPRHPSAKRSAIGNWKQVHVPSRRRHVATELEQFEARHLMQGERIVGVSVGGWDIGTSQGPIGDEMWLQEASANLENLAQFKLQAPDQRRRIALPEMVFPSAYVMMERNDGSLILSWNAFDALKEWAEAHQALPLENSKVISFRGVNVMETSDAAIWKQREKHKKGGGDAQSDSYLKSSSATFHYDWTYSTPFCGKLYGPSRWTRLNASAMPMHLLTDQTVPILLYDDIVIFEDDLHDNGEVQLRIKLRVMPTCAYILSRLFVRVDGVLLRLRECRFLLDVVEQKMYRDIIWRECAWSDLETHQLSTDSRTWVQDANNESSAFAFLLSKLPQVETPRDIYTHSVMALCGTEGSEKKSDQEKPNPGSPVHHESEKSFSTISQLDEVRDLSSANPSEFT